MPLIAFSMYETPRQPAPVVTHAARHAATSAVQPSESSGDEYELAAIDDQHRPEASAAPAAQAELVLRTSAHSTSARSEHRREHRRDASIASPCEGRAPL